MFTYYIVMFPARPPRNPILLGGSDDYEEAAERARKLRTEAVLKGKVPADEYRAIDCEEAEELFTKNELNALSR